VKKIELSKSKKIKILLIAIVVIAVAGLSFLLYPAFTNVVGRLRQTEAISEWETLKEAQSEEEAEPVEEETREVAAEDFFPLKMIIPAVEMEFIVNEGADRQTLKSGPGHIPETPLPGDIGRCTLSGHMTTYGAPFNKIGSLEEGDLIYLETIGMGTFIYAVTGLEVVKPKDVYILESTGKKELLLTSCHPEYSAAERIILIAELINIYQLDIASVINQQLKK
jgi:LPXTG-site transpeptidase (sortase) family protein